MSNYRRGAYTNREKLTSGPSTNSCGVLAYITRKLARQGGNRMTLPDHHQARPYRCTTCHLWHVGFIPRLVSAGVVTADEWYGRHGPCYRDILIPLLELARRHLGGQPWIERHHDQLWTAAGHAYGDTLYARDYPDPVSAIEALIHEHDHITDQLTYPYDRIEDAA